MEKTRVKKGEYHWYIKCLSDIDIDCITDDYDESDDRYFESGNYFHTKEEAEAMARKLRAVLKGADVIEMPSMEKQNIMKKLREKGVTEKEKKHGCFDCRWCKKVSYMNTPCMDFYCKQHSKFDFVTGQVEYEPCRNVTNCDKWEIGGIKGFIQRLFKSKNKINV